MWKAHVIIEAKIKNMKGYNKTRNNLNVRGDIVYIGKTETTRDSRNGKIMRKTVLQKLEMRSLGEFDGWGI